MTDTNFKKQAALAALPLIQHGMIVGMGAGATIAYLAEAIANKKGLASSLTIVSSSEETIRLLEELGFTIADAGRFDRIDLYFDGCDQVDANLHALKSGAGIHAIEKVLAFMADEFIILADAAKFADALNTVHPLTLEVLPEAIGKVSSAIRKQFLSVNISLRKKGDDPILTRRKNLLVDLRFGILPPPGELDQLKMLPGVIDHSLFYGIASQAILAGPGGIKKITASR